MIHPGIEKRGNKDRSLAEELSPRDLLFLKNLAKHDLTLIEIKVSPISPVLGLTIAELSLPEKSLVINVIKGAESYFPSEDHVLEEGDLIYFLASKTAENSLKEVFVPLEYK